MFCEALVVLLQVTIAYGGGMKVGGFLNQLCDECVVDGGWGYYPFQGSCNQYLHCSETAGAYLETCAVGTFYDGKICRHARDVKCPSDPCKTKPSGYKYSDGQTCYGFYKCMNGRSNHKECPPKMCFKSEFQGCTFDPTCIQPRFLSHPCQEMTTHPFPGHYNKFYLYDGKDTFTPMRCPKSLWYNPSICTCDWVIPGKAEDDCEPLYHFRYNGNFFEKYNRAPQIPNYAVSIFNKAAFFAPGGKILIWMMNDLEMGNEFALSFEFMAKTYDGEIALLSNSYKDLPFTYKITFIPSKRVVKGYFLLNDGVKVDMTVHGVEPSKPHTVRLAKYMETFKMKVDTMPEAVVHADCGLAATTNPMIIGEASGCNGLVGFFDELKFFKCIPAGFLNDDQYKKK
ncbi:hypothetical protein ScPMuIL_007157 [Solemya velum]